MKYNWREIPSDFGRALLVAILFFALIYATQLAEIILAESQDCSTDTECMAKYGGDGGPEPAANRLVCIHTDHSYPCIH